CAASDLVHFRKRIGKEGIDYLFSLSAQLHKTKIAKAKEVIVDTTVQESKTTFPTDAKLYKKVIERCNAIAKQSKVTLRQSYRLKT
ncbi:MAG: IS5/IS1182 family transposase, partial [Bacteroidota bacterium]